RISYGMEDTLGEVLVRVQERALESESHHYSPLSDVQSLSSLGMNLFDHIMVFENYPIAEEIAGMGDGGEGSYEVVDVSLFEQTNYGLTILVAPGEKIQMRFDYNPEEYEDGLMEGLRDRLLRIVDQVTEDSEQKILDLDFLSESERDELLYEFNDTVVEYPRDKTIVDLFEEQVVKTPDYVAVRFHDEDLTYSKLNERANRVANYLLKEGLEKEEIISVLLHDSIDMIVGIFGILKAGGCYLPIDPDYPVDRINHMLKDSNTRTVITTNDIAETLEELVPLQCIDLSDQEIEKCSCDNQSKDISSSDLAYIIYTSGTTGLPKGVMIEHKNVVRLLFNDANLFSFDDDVWTMFHSYSFDFSVWEMYGALLNGGKLILISKEESRDPRKFLKILNQEKVTVLNLTPTVFGSLMDEVMEMKFDQLSIKQVIFGGEKLMPGKIQSWLEEYPEIQMINMYGVTETTVHTTYKELVASDIETGISNIGSPIPTTRIYVLSQDGKLNPIGVPGEMYIGGEGVGRGYLRNNGLTSEKFIPDPFRDEGRIYRTGDLGRWLDGGEIEFLGRIDDQVKIRGFRIELGEIENQLLNHNQIKEAVVLLKENQNEEFLIAFYTSSKPLYAKNINTFLAKNLPHYMIPSYFIHLDEIPLTTSGKLNKQYLLDLEVQIDQDYIQPHNSIEEKLVEIWSDILRLNKSEISISANFFDVGGNSLKIVALSKAVNETFNCDIQVASFFKFPTIKGIGEYLSGDDAKLDALNKRADDSARLDEIVKLFDN
ncbi:MAG: amino acid adenylation domain-containing protein, partial [Cyclobacteriaceae bacterium]